jgi:hypothetical protein
LFYFKGACEKRREISHIFGGILRSRPRPRVQGRPRKNRLFKLIRILVLTYALACDILRRELILMSSARSEAPARI